MPPVDISVGPYFDTTDFNKLYARLLFKPRIAVQTREVNELQTLLQQQISRFGQHIFKEGSLVLPGEIKFDTRYTYLLVNSNLVGGNPDLADSDYREANLHNRIIYGPNINEADPTNIRALVVGSLEPDTNGYVTLFIKYIHSAGASGDSTFADGQTLYRESSSISLPLKLSGATGFGSAASISEGVYFARGYFIKVNTQTLILDAYGNTPSYRVGLQIVESVVTADDDPDLVDNANGSLNYAAPGADRLKIELVLTKKLLTDNDAEGEKDFIELLRLENGDATRKVDSTAYNIILKTLARRTHDESGNYTVRPFIAKPVEHPSDDTKLLLNVDPGKAYVFGYEVETIAKTTVEFNRARTSRFSNNASVDSRMGNYILVRDVLGIPDVKRFKKYNLFNRPFDESGATLIGTARIKAIQYDYTDSTAGDVYQIFLFDIDIEDGYKFEQIKYISDASDNTNISFTPAHTFRADVHTSLFPLTGTVSSDSNTLNGFGTQWVVNPAQVLHVGDYIQVGTVPYRILTVVSDSEITVTPTPATPITGAPVSFLFAELFDSDLNTLVFPLPQKWVKTVRGENLSQVDTNYTVLRTFANVTAASNQVTLSLISPDEEFVGFSKEDYYGVIVSTDGVDPYGTPVLLNSSTFDESGFPSTAIITGLESGKDYTFVATVRKKQGTASQEKTKTLSVVQTLQTPASQTNLQSVSLDKADIFVLSKVCMATGFTGTATSSDEDITDRYELDNGQRDSHYAIGAINLKKNVPIPTGSLYIEFQYFQHGGNSNYFSVDSYSGIDYEDIPSYTSPTTGEKFDLRDCLDFRPTMNTSGTAFDEITGSLTELTRESMILDFHYYLNRIDKLYLNQDGQFQILEGVPNISPKPPADPEDGMLLYTLNVRAYTATPADVFLDYIENKRYTMRDIGDIDERLKRVEYYTSLNLLEKETASLAIKDSDGLDRFKNGFIVDSFSGHGVGDVLNDNYKCAIDMKQSRCRPKFVRDNFAIVQRDTPNDGTGYRKTGDLITLDYTDFSAIVQKKATAALNVNPYAVFTFIGSIKMNPDSDEWVDTTQAPDLVINDEGNYDAIAKMVNNEGVVWSDWEDLGGGTVRILSTESVRGPREIAPVGTTHVDSARRGAGKKHNKKSKPGDDWPFRETTITRTTQSVDQEQTRKGIKTRVSPKIIQKDGGDKVLNVSFLPYMRSKDVQIKAKGFKPNTKLYAFFDGLSVDGYCSVDAVFNPNFTSTFNPSNLFTITPCVTDAEGKVSAVFRIPNSDSVRFKTGAREFKLTDRATNDSQATTFGSSLYRAEGLLETHQKTIISTKVPEFTSEEVIGARTVSNVSFSDDVVKSPWRDPLAQSFMVLTEGGMFVTKLKLYFQTKDSNLPITVQIREMVNGYPGTKVLPFSEVVVDSDDVHTNEVSNEGLLILDGVATVTPGTADNFVATEITFPSPVYCKQGEEYCFVVFADSTNYTAWIATGGQNNIGTEIPVTDQPYLGVLFKSQNASTWTADQLSDMKFEIMGAQFTETSATCYFENSDLPVQTLRNNPLLFKDGSKIVRVYHPNHGLNFVDGSVTPNQVTLAGVESDGVDLSKLYGIPLTQLNTRHEVQSVTLDSYTIEVATTPAEVPPAVLVNSSRILGGGANVTATENKQMDSFQLIVSDMVLPDTGITYGIKTTTGRSVAGSQIPYDLDSDFTTIIEGQAIDFETPRLVCSTDNEQGDVILVPGGSRSFFLAANLQRGSNQYISPVIDVSRLSGIAIGNRLDSPTYLDNIDGIDDETILTSTLLFDVTAGNSFETDSDSLASLVAGKTSVGKYIRLSSGGSPTPDAANIGTFRIVSKTYDPGTDPNLVLVLENAADTTADMTVESGKNFDIEILDNFVSELAPTGGSVSSKYITRRFTLANPSTGLKILLGVYRDASATVDLYYKLGRVDDPTSFDELPYVKADLDNIATPSINERDLKEYSATVNGAEEFNVISVEVVMTGTNSAKPPQLEDLRVIALDS